MTSRIGRIARTTGETDISVELNIDGTGTVASNTGVPEVEARAEPLPVVAVSWPVQPEDSTPRGRKSKTQWARRLVG